MGQPGTHQGWFSSQSARRQRRLRGNSAKRLLNSSGGMWETMFQRDILGTVTCREMGGEWGEGGYCGHSTTLSSARLGWAVPQS